MAYQNTHRGIIVTPAVRSTALVNELIALCDWPVLAQPSLRTLVEFIDLHRPLCLLFWLEAARDIPSAAALIATLRDRGPRPYRIAIAHCLDQRGEHSLRTAGVHSYFATSGDLQALVEDTLIPLIERHDEKIHGHIAPPAGMPVRIHSPTDPRASPASTHPL
jgi:hypothetical protein